MRGQDLTNETTHTTTAGTGKTHTMEGNLGDAKDYGTSHPPDPFSRTHLINTPSL